MARRIDGPKLYYLRANLGDKAAIARATGRREFGDYTGFILNGFTQRTRQGFVSGDEGTSPQNPINRKPQARFSQNGIDPLT